MTTDRQWMFNPARHCKDSNLMFPEDGHGTIIAKLVCCPIGAPPCPVLDQCLNYALAEGEIHGVWAGLSQRERQRIKRGGNVPRRGMSNLARRRQMEKVA